MRQFHNPIATGSDALDQVDAPLEFVREDWTLFRTLSTLTQKAGVPAERLRRLVLKELVDNALDVAGACTFGLLPGGGFFVQDQGDGIRGSPEDIARLFSI